MSLPPPISAPPSAVRSQSWSSGCAELISILSAAVASRDVCASAPLDSFCLKGATRALGTQRAARAAHEQHWRSRNRIRDAIAAHVRRPPPAGILLATVAADVGPRGPPRAARPPVPRARAASRRTRQTPSASLGASCSLGSSSGPGLSAAQHVVALPHEPTGVVHALVV